MKNSLKMLITCQLSDAQHLMMFDDGDCLEKANYLLNAAKVMLRMLDDKDVDFDEVEKEVVEKLSNAGITEGTRDLRSINC